MKTYLLILALAAFSFPTFSQQCTSDSTRMFMLGDISFADEGFADPNALSCIRNGKYSELVIPFKSYSGGARLLTLPDSSTVPVAKIYSLRIDNVTGLPSGMCWAVRPSTGTVSGEQAGGLIIKGTTTAVSGVYYPTVTISIDVTGSGYTYTNLAPANYKNILGQAAIKVAGSNGACPAVN